MIQNDVINFIEYPSKLNDSTIADITLLAEQYPYFQVAQLLRIKNLHNIAPETIKPALNYTAAFITDRKILYYLLHPIEEETLKKEIIEEEVILPEKLIEFKSPEKQIKDTLQENISDTLSNQIDYYKNSVDSEIEFSTAIDIKKEYGQGIELDDLVMQINTEEHILIELAPESITEITEKAPENTIDKTLPAPPEKDTKKQDILSLINKGVPADLVIPESSPLTEAQKKKNLLIDSFITTNPRIKPTIPLNDEQKDISEDSVREHDHLITDTLAAIYLKQGNYAKAIFAYEKLSLKYPEKSTYFAAQINDIKNLIDKNK